MIRLSSHFAVQGGDGAERYLISTDTSMAMPPTLAETLKPVDIILPTVRPRCFMDSPNPLKEVEHIVFVLHDYRLVQPILPVERFQGGG